MVASNLETEIREKFRAFFENLELPPEYINGFMRHFKVTEKEPIGTASVKHEQNILQLSFFNDWGVNENGKFVVLVNPVAVMRNVHSELIKILGEPTQYFSSNNFDFHESGTRFWCEFSGSDDKVLKALDAAFDKYTKIHPEISSQMGALKVAGVICTQYDILGDDLAKDPLRNALPEETQIRFRSKVKEFIANREKWLNDPLNDTALQCAEYIVKVWQKSMKILEAQKTADAQKTRDEQSAVITSMKEMNLALSGFGTASRFSGS